MLGLGLARVAVRAWAQPVAAAVTASASAAFSSQAAVAAEKAAAGEAKRPVDMTDEEIMEAVVNGEVKFFDLENELEQDYERAVRIRRRIVDDQISTFVDAKDTLADLPYKGFDYSNIHGRCAENVVGYMPIPVGVAGPLLVDGTVYQVPMATTEGALIASTARGCKAITLSGGATTAITKDAMTRAPVLRLESLSEATKFVEYIERNFEEVRAQFESTSRFAKLVSIDARFAGNLVYLRFACKPGAAMGMNMTGKGVEKALAHLSENAPFDFDVMALSGNVCTDKKFAAINWVEGRGKSVSADAVIKGDVVRTLLKSSVKSMAYVNYCKNLVGSAVAGSIGGQNAHASNIVTAAFIAAGQDPAQNVESSACLVTMEDINDGQDLYVSVNMPSIEVGTIGGGTTLPAQSACLKMMGVHGSGEDGNNAQRLASIVAATVMAGELSLCAALSSGHLMSGHMKLNRGPGRRDHDRLAGVAEKANL
ncbi:3-hydroxy-3-methylglutaryl-coenzyme A reductase 1 [Thecamonas trahens ATCC 50062]|uniref:3-hydroxy-3-methylglutaryl coenzyme A reductase n=1 Tax=Thecamonas trahens ATCC 50062 TaxID=461836 RepID=A0A0L0DC29_THETB|nr:3-hydroxy-3-methylglutaryl-coenzyme A reductase 1 [Thecamonas trahens ATCC 50062]KNC48863.1 3-hydroxy-3-methylglutaryl-coenzyme A reductase 1 [Thecamonas trahens ATCC 50062]|eukprot:XP_013758283.1 3-hydroxy-3-methylglutaryl-coenzyme A reductase 1 [Thecamonas trahens ATCC 50062]